MVDKNIDALLHWDFAHLQSLEFEYAYGRQGNLYAGDTQNTNTNALVQNNYGKETNRIYRETFGLTHRGAWDNGVSTNNYVQFERTRNTRINEGLAGGTEGIFDTKIPVSALPSWTTSWRTAKSACRLSWAFHRPPPWAPSGASNG